jgi:formamidopyrimidine-DNA glycosylase
MPELPEVEVTRRGLLEQLPGRTIVDITWSAHQLRTEIPRRLLQEHITRQQILTIDRRAKYLLVRMKSEATLVIHLGMTGKLGLMRQETASHKHDHLVLRLDNAMELRFNDSRRFGAIAVWPAAQALENERKFSDREGIEPFDSTFTAQHLLNLAKGRQVPVKSFLMNTQLVAGIGNIYANEILFAAGINGLLQNKPTFRDEPLPGNGRQARGWRQGVYSGGSTIADFLGASGHPGYFQLQFNVYGRKDAPCPECAQSIVKITLAGRATYYCPICQLPA